MLSPGIIEEARKFSNAEEGNAYYKAHIEYLQRITSILMKGGSALLKGEFGNTAIKVSSKYPEKLFENLDQDWKLFAREADTGEIGFMVPPVLSIILTRCARRDAIPAIIKDLRDEWAGARNKVWVLLNQLKTIRTVKEMRTIRKELSEASLLLSPSYNALDTNPVRVLWDLAIGTVAGTCASLISGGDPSIGATIGAIINVASQSIPPLIREVGPALFGRGAFDLARRIRKEAMSVEYDALAKLLTDAEKRNLGP